MDSQFIEKYEVLETLGKGSMGVVYKARDPEIGRMVAIKTLKSIFLSEDAVGKEALQRFRQESRSAGRLHHPNIVTIFEAGRTQNGSPYIVMEYIEGKSLEALLRDSNEKNGCLEPLQAFHYLAQIADAIDYAHSHNIIHRDIKPSNIIVDKHHRPFLLDFGVAKLSDTSLTPAGTVVGTPSYMSPEQIRGEQLDSRSDLFSYAVVVYEVLTGRRPFPGNDFASVVSNILQKSPLTFAETNSLLPKHLESVLFQALSREKEGRFPTASAFIDAAVQTLGISVDNTGLIGGYRDGMKLSELATMEQGGRVRAHTIHRKVPGPSALNSSLGGVMAVSARELSVEDSILRKNSTETAKQNPDNIPPGRAADLSEYSATGHIVGGGDEGETRFIRPSQEFFRQASASAPEASGPAKTSDWASPQGSQPTSAAVNNTQATKGTAQGFKAATGSENLARPTGAGVRLGSAVQVNDEYVGQAKNTAIAFILGGVVLVAIIAAGTWMWFDNSKVAISSEEKVATTTKTEPAEPNTETDSDAVSEENPVDDGSNLVPKRPTAKIGGYSAADLKGLQDEELAWLVSDQQSDLKQLRLIIAEVGNRRSADLILRLLPASMHQDYTVRIEVLKSLSRSEYRTNPEVLAIIVSALADSEFLVRGFAVKTLAAIGTPEAVRALEARESQEKNQVVLKVIQDSLAALRRK